MITYNVKRSTIEPNNSNCLVLKKDGGKPQYFFEKYDTFISFLEDAEFIKLDEMKSNDGETIIEVWTEGG